MPEEKPALAAAVAEASNPAATPPQRPPSDDHPPDGGNGSTPVEIERRFLVVNDGWKTNTRHSEHLRDGLVARFGEGKVRIRVGDSQASLTIKGPRIGLTRQEFEYEIPRAHAEQMLHTLCAAGPMLEKIRHTVPFGGLNWTIDVYMGELAGLIFAEVELLQANQPFELPPWAGEEVTNNPRFRKHALLALSRDVVRDKSRPV